MSLNLEVRLVERTDKGGVLPIVSKGGIPVDKDELLRLSPALTSRMHLVLDSLISDSLTALTDRNPGVLGSRAIADDILDLHKYAKQHPNEVSVTKWRRDGKVCLCLEMEDKKHGT